MYVAVAAALLLLCRRSVWRLPQSSSSSVGAGSEHAVMVYVNSARLPSLLTLKQLTVALENTK